MLKIDPMQGGWIAHTDWTLDSRPLSEHPVAFRKDFNLPAKPTGAELLVTGADKFALWLNGQLIDFGPARSFPRDKIYDVYDIAPFLRKGVNHLAAIVLPCWGSNFLTNFTRMGLLVQAKIALPGRQVVNVASDESWHCRLADWIKLDFKLISLPIGPQEHAAQTSASGDWTTDTPDAAWTPALYLGPVDCPPWTHLRPRPTPRLIESPITPRLVWQGRSSRTLVDTRANLAAAFNQERLQGQAVPALDGSGRFGSRQENTWTFDFGKTRLIRPVLEVGRVSGKVRLELYYDMELKDRPTAFMGFGSPTEGSCDSFVPRDGGCQWEVLVPRGFRFLSVKVAGQGSAEFRLNCRRVDYPYDELATFATGDAFLQKVWDISKENIRSSTADTVVDCCSRENLLWTMDAAVTLKAGFYSFGETAMWRHCLDLIGQGIDADGRPGAIVPTDVPSSLFCQTMHWVISAREYYLATGDATLGSAVAEPLKRFLSLCGQYVTDEDLFVPPAYSWHWVDWAAIDKRPYSLPINALLVMAADAAGELAKVIAHKELLGVAGQIGQRVRRALAGFFDAKKNAFRSHIEPRKPLHRPMDKSNSRSTDVAMTLAHNVHANVLAALAGGGTLAMRKAALAHAAWCFDQPAGPINRIGMGYADVLLRPLADAGHVPSVLRQLRAMYQPSIDAGAPTWPSQASGNSPFNTAHGWSASVNSLIAEALVGLRPGGPGFASIVLAPAKGLSLDHEYSLRTPSGEVWLECRAGHRAARWPKGLVLSWGGQRHTGTGKTVQLKG